MRKPDKVLRRFEQYPVQEFGISSVTHAELLPGVEKSKYKSTNQDTTPIFILILPKYPNIVSKKYHTNWTY